MAKAKDTTSPPSISRRKVFAGVAAVPLMPDPALSRGQTCQGETDPVLTLWQEWRQADAEAEARYAKWQKLELQLFKTVGSPCVPVPTADDEFTIYVINHDGIEDLLGDAPETAAMREHLHASLASHQARWDNAAAAIEFDTVAAQYRAADERAEALREKIFKTPARTPAGIAAKLALVVATGQSLAELAEVDEFPWLPLRCVLADLLGLAALTELG